LVRWKTFACADVAVEPVIPLETKDLIVAGAAIDLVAAARADQRVVARPSIDHTHEIHSAEIGNIERPCARIGLRARQLGYARGIEELNTVGTPQPVNLNLLYQRLAIGIRSVGIVAPFGRQ